MTDPLRIRAAVVAASLAGDEGPWAAFSRADRAAAERVLARLRASGDRRRVAEAIVAERFAVTRATEPRVSPDLGARLYARWMRSLDPAARARVARGLDAHDLTHIASHAPAAVAFEGPEAACASWLVAQGARALGRLPTARELATLLSALRGESDVTSAALVRWERALRVGGRRAACEALALSLGDAT